MDKLIITEAEYECLAKGIAFGVGIGIVVGIIVDNVTLFFALGGVVGILSASILSIIRKVRLQRTQIK